MNILKSNWLKELPLDYELKKYIFLSAYARFENEISNNQLFSTLNEIEYHLNKLYRLKYEKDELDDTRRIITGIDLDLMDLIYDYTDEDSETEDIYKIIDYSIIKLESLHTKLREQWRYISKCMLITEIPDKKPTKNKGIVFIVLENTIKVYSYTKPSNMSMGWESLILNKEGEIKNSLRKIAEFISASERQSNDNRFWRFDAVNLDIQNIPYDNCILPIVNFNLFNRLKFN
jgi:hypothetical protein